MLLEGIVDIMTGKRNCIIRIFIVTAVEMQIFLPYYHRVTKNLL